MKIGFAISLLAVSLLCVYAMAQENTTGNWYKKGNDLYDNGSYEEALSAYDKAIQIDPSNADAWLGKGDATKALFLNESDLTVPPEVFGNDQHYADYWAERANSFSSVRRIGDAGIAYEKAVQLYDQILAKNPKDADAWINKGRALVNLVGTYLLGDDKNSTKLSEEALQSFDKAIEIDPWNSRAWCAKATALSNESKRLQAYNRAIELDPENEEAWVYRGIALASLAGMKSNQSLYEEALKSYDKALEINPDPRTWMDKAHLLIKLNRYNDSVKAYDTAIGLIPANNISRLAYFWRMKGNAMKEIGKQEDADEAYNESLKWLDKAIELNPQDPGAWTSKGYFLIHPLGRYNESLEAFDKAIELIPANATGKLAYFWLKKAFALDQISALDQLNRTEEALNALDKVIELDPKDARGWIGKGWTLRDLGRYEESLQAYENAIDLHPTQRGVLSSAWDGKAQTLKALGRYNESLAAFDKVIELDSMPMFTWAEKGVCFDGVRQESRSFRCLRVGHRTRSARGQVLVEEGISPGSLRPRIQGTNVVLHGEEAGVHRVTPGKIFQNALKLARQI